MVPRYNLQSLATVSYSMFGGTNVPGAYQSIGFANAPDAVHTGTSVANGAGLENVRLGASAGVTITIGIPTGTLASMVLTLLSVRQQRQGFHLRQRGCSAGPGWYLQPRLQHCSGGYHHSLDPREEPDVLG